MTERVRHTSYSAITQHRACPQQWQYQRMQKLDRFRADDIPVELNFGQWWHALRAADSITRGRENGTLQHLPETIQTVDDGPEISTAESDDGKLTEAVLDAASRWWESLPHEVQDEWHSRIGGTLPDRLAYVDARWHERWDADTKHEQPLAVEFRWKRELPTLSDPETGEIANPNTVMVGFVDEIFYDTKRKIVVVRDHKSHKALGAQSAVDDMMDSQLQVYSWGASTQVTEWGYGPVRAVAYDRVRSTAPKTPKLTLTGTLSKSVKDYDLTTYLTFAAGPDGQGVPFEGRKKDGSGAGVYHAEDAEVARLSDPAAHSAWLQRTLTPLNRNVITTHLRASVDTAFDISRTVARVEESGEAARNLTSRCKWCPFAELCRAEMTGGPGGEYDLAAFGLTRRK